MPQKQADAATSSTINFQARLLTAAGNVVPDGYYNVEFKLYKTATPDGGETAIQGDCKTNPGNVSDEDCVWTETRVGADKVRVSNGYLTVNLGSVTAFANGINWDQELWLTMNIGGTGSPSWDGEMNPRLKLTSVPYAFRAGALVSADGLNVATVDESGTICIQDSVGCGFVQGVAADFIQNQTSSDQAGNIRLQSADASKAAVLLKGASSQSADILQVQDGSSNPLFAVGNTGGISLSGSGYATFTTPASNSAHTKINIPLYDPGAGSQTIALGLSSSANSSARAIAVFDARSGAHAPTIAVVSPDESKVLGFSWDGSNSNALVKTDAAEVSLSANGLTILSAKNVSSVARVGIGNISPAYPLDVTGDINSTTGLLINGVTMCDTTGCTAKSGSAYYIQNQSSSDQSADFRLSGTGRASIFQAGTFDTASGTTTLAIGTTNATTINLNQNTALGSGKTLTVASALTSLTGATSGDALNVSNSTSTGNIVIFKDNTTAVATIADGGSALFQAATDSTTAFRILSRTNSVPEFVVDTSNNAVKIGGGDVSPDASPVIFLLDYKNTSGDPTGINGGMYYNSNTNKFRCYQNSAWADCVGATTLQAAYTGSTGGTTPEIKLDSTRGGLSIQDADTTIGSSTVLMAVRGSNASGLGTALFSIQGSGATTIQSGNGNAFAVKNAAGTSSAFNVDTTNNYVGIGNTTAARTLDVYINSSSTSSSSPAIRVTQAGTGDVAMEYANPSNTYYTGIDTSDSNSFKISSINMNSVNLEAGFHENGSGTDGGNDPLISATQVTTGTNGGTLSSLNFYFPSTGSGTYKGAIYADNGSNQPGALIASSNSAQTIVAGWNQLSISATLSGSTNYWIAFRLSSSGTSFGYTTGTGGNGRLCWTSYGYGNSTWLDPFGTPSAGCSGTERYSVYAVYATSSSQDTFASSILKLTDTGAATFTSSSTSTTAFQIVSGTGTGVPMFVVDTTNNLVKIGNGDTSPDQTPALLVLDERNTASDPPYGNEGAMYYNSVLHQFRCYRSTNTVYDGMWEACATNPVDSGWQLTDDFVGGNTTSGTMGELGWTQQNNTATYTHNPSSTMSTMADHPGNIQIATGSGSGNGGTLTLDSTTNGSVTLSAGLVVKTTVGFNDSTISSTVFRTGLHNERNSSSRPTKGVWWEAAPGTNSRWQYCYYNGSSAVCSNATNGTAQPPTVAINTWYRLEIRVMSTGSGTSGMEFMINGSKYTVGSATLDTSGTVEPGMSLFNSAGATRTANIDYFQMRGTASALR